MVLTSPSTAVRNDDLDVRIDDDIGIEECGDDLREGDEDGDQHELQDDPGNGTPINIARS